MVLTIDPSTTKIGYAIFYNRALKDFGEFNPNRRDVISLFSSIKDFFIDYINSWKVYLKTDISVILVERAFISAKRGMKKSAKLAVVNELFEDIANDLGTECKFLANATVKKRVAGSSNASKSDVAKVVVAVFSELKDTIKFNKKTNKYIHLDISDSVALFCAEYGEQ